MKIKGAIILGGYVNALAVARGFVDHGLEAILVNNKKFQPANFSRKTTFIKSPAISETKDFLDFLNKLPKKYKNKSYWLIPTCDLGVELLSRNKNDFQKDYLVFADDLEKIELIEEKDKIFGSIKNIANIPNYKVYKQDLAGLKDFKFPVIIKSRLPHAHDLKKIKIVAQTYTEAQKELQNLPISLRQEGVIVQQYLAGLKQLSFSCFARNGEIIRFFMSEKVRSRPAEYGSFTIIKSIYSPELYKIAQEILSKISYSGVCEVEFLFDSKSNKFIFLEINPRFWMQNGLAKKIGVDLIEPLINPNALKQNSENSYKIGVKWVHFYSDLAQAISEIKKKTFSLSDYLVGLKGEKMEAAFSWSDPIPFLIETGQALTALMKGKL